MTPAPIEEGAPEERRPRPARILIAEDNPALRELLVEFTTLLGYESTAVTAGEDALAAAGVRPPDLLLCDAGLPGISGPEVCRRFKAGPGTGRVPVLLITGMGGENRSSLYQAGADGVLLKPFAFDELRAEIQRLLAARPPCRETSGPPENRA